jgi:hypothetical protein
MRQRQAVGIAAFGLVAAIAGTGCSDRASMQSSSTDRDRTPVTVTGCFQEASGMDNFVLTNVTEGTPEQRARGYRVERGRDTDQHVGKQVKVTGWIESTDTASMQPNGTNSGSSAAQGQDKHVGFNDFPELHVQSIERVSDNCGSTPGNSGR